VIARRTIRRRKTKGTWAGRISRLRQRAARVWVFTARAAAVIGALGALSLLFVWGYHYVLTSPHMRLTEVRIDGVDDDFKEELLAGAGLTGNMSLLELNLGELKRLLEAHPWISRAGVERRFPHSLHISVHKEVPAAVVAMDGLFYMNPDGRVFKAVDITESLDHPFVTGVSMLAAESREQLRQAAHVISCIAREKPPWSDGLSEIHMGRDGYVSLYFRHLNAEIRVAWSDVDGKMPALRRLVAHLRERGRLGRVAAIDLNQENGAVVSMTSG